MDLQLLLLLLLSNLHLPKSTGCPVQAQLGRDTSTLNSPLTRQLANSLTCQPVNPKRPQPPPSTPLPFADHCGHPAHNGPMSPQITSHRSLASPSLGNAKINLREKWATVTTLSLLESTKHIEFVVNKDPQKHPIFLQIPPLSGRITSLFSLHCPHSATGYRRLAVSDMIPAPYHPTFLTRSRTEALGTLSPRNLVTCPTPCSAPSPMHECKNALYRCTCHLSIQNQQHAQVQPQCVQPLSRRPLYRVQTSNCRQQIGLVEYPAVGHFSQIACKSADNGRVFSFNKTPRGEGCSARRRFSTSYRYRLRAVAYASVPSILSTWITIACSSS